MNAGAELVETGRYPSLVGRLRARLLPRHARLPSGKFTVEVRILRPSARSGYSWSSDFPDAFAQSSVPGFLSGPGVTASGSSSRSFDSTPGEGYEKRLSHKKRSFERIMRIAPAPSSTRRDGQGR